MPWPFMNIPLPSPSLLFTRPSSATSTPGLTHSVSPEQQPLNLLTPDEETLTTTIPGAWKWDKSQAYPCPKELNEADLIRRLNVEKKRKRLSAGREDGKVKKGSLRNEVAIDTTEEAAVFDAERDIRVTALWVHPIKSCRGISVESSILNPEGLQYDRQWAIREIETGKICTAREYAKMVLITSTIDEENNKLKVSFPEGEGLEGFDVPLNATLEEMKMWERTPITIMFKKPLPTSLITPTSASSSTTNAHTQLSTFLGRSVQLIQSSPFPDDVRICGVPDGEGEGETWREDVEAEVGGSKTGFADGYPVLIANEESYRSVASSVNMATLPEPPSLFANLGPTFEKSNWTNRSFDTRRFRANIIVGSSKDLAASSYVPPSESDDQVQAEDGEKSGEDTEKTERKPLEAWEEDTWREVEFLDSKAEGERKGSLFCVSRCGRCQLPNVDPETAEADKAVPFKILAKYRRVDPAQKFTPIFGVNAVPRENQISITVGDRVRILRRNGWGVLPVADGKTS